MRPSWSVSKPARDGRARALLRADGTISPGGHELDGIRSGRPPMRNRPTACPDPSGPDQIRSDQARSNPRNDTCDPRDPMSGRVEARLRLRSVTWPCVCPSARDRPDLDRFVAAVRKKKAGLSSQPERPAQFSPPPFSSRFHPGLRAQARDAPESVSLACERSDRARSPWPSCHLHQSLLISCRRPPRLAPP
jgi:hypothetical protein